MAKKSLMGNLGLDEKDMKTLKKAAVATAAVAGTLLAVWAGAKVIRKAARSVGKAWRDEDYEGDE